MQLLHKLSSVTQGGMGFGIRLWSTGWINLLKGKAESVKKNEGVEGSLENHEGLLSSSNTDELDIDSDVTGICVLLSDSD